VPDRQLPSFVQAYPSQSPLHCLQAPFMQVLDAQSVSKVQEAELQNEPVPAFALLLQLLQAP
jgi:hypothetical protein